MIKVSLILIFLCTVLLAEEREETKLPKELREFVPKVTKKAKKKAIRRKLEAFSLNNLFSTTENPGRGSLLYTKGGTGQEIKFGNDGGHYGYGLVFRSDILPQPHRHEFKNQKVIQIVFGSTGSSEKLAEFATLSLLAEKLPSNRIVYKIIGQKKRLLASETGNSALVLFSPPDLKKDIPEAAKLRNTWFGKSGQISLLGISSIEQSSSFFNKKRLVFRGRMMELNFSVKLGTPFTPDAEANLEGKIVIPIYWPANNAAHELTDELATLSLDDS